MMSSYELGRTSTFILNLAPYDNFLFIKKKKSNNLRFLKIFLENYKENSFDSIERGLDVIQSSLHWHRGRYGNRCKYRLWPSQVKRKNAKTKLHQYLNHLYDYDI
jgi:hypothetical protein